jgi:class 3 adenylate cyclase
MSAMDLVAKLATLFGNFDRILERNDLDKVKTLGTSYVAALGISGELVDHSVAALGARQLREATATFAAEHDLELSFRCGIATGIAVSGVIAGSRPNFDIWGAALEEASVNCETAQPGQILVNENAYWRLRAAIPLRALSGHERTYEVVGA